MASSVKSAKSFLVSTDIGVAHVTLSTVTGYDVEDIVRDKAVSFARAIQLMNAGKEVDMSKPTGARTLSSIWLNNDLELG